MSAYCWHAGRVWLDTGMRDYLGRAVLWSLTQNGVGRTTFCHYPVTGTQLTVCERIWGMLR